MSDVSAPAKMFDETPGTALMVQSDAAAVARATQEIQAALVIAQRVPRDEVAVRAKILQACKRKELAAAAEYEYSRGGTRITGPTVDLLRAIANRWRNIRYGWSEVERKDGASSVRCFAWDMETNSQAERTFSVKHWRDTKLGGYVLTDERDIYEMLANSAARRVRACLEEVIDSDVVEMAIEQCRKTLKEGETVSLQDRAVRIVSSYAQFGVTQLMIETRLGNKLEALSENQYASLRRVYKSLQDGVGKVEDYFKPEALKPEFANAGAAAPAQTGAGDGSTANPAPVATQPSKPATAPSPAPVEPTAVTLLGSIRRALASHKIKEGLLLDYWASSGATDGSYGTLEEVQLAKPAVISETFEKWVEVLAKLNEVREAQKRFKHEA